MPPKCPHCKVELEYDSRVDTENCGYYYYERWIGYCPKCKKEFCWDKIYNFSHHDGMEEIGEKEELE